MIPWPPGKIKEVFMDHNTWAKLDDIRAALSGSVGVLLALADGLDGYTHSGALSGADAAAYAGTLFSVYDTLTGLSRQFSEALERAC